jgi:acyl transferase domain-containing protein
MYVIGCSIVFRGRGSVGSRAVAELRSCSNILLSPAAVSGAALSVVAGRLSFVNGWSGPAMTVDTACSSSLVALDAASHAVTFSTSMAIVGGVNLILVPKVRITLVSKSER